MVHAIPHKQDILSRRRPTLYTTMPYKEANMGRFDFKFNPKHRGLFILRNRPRNEIVIPLFGCHIMPRVRFLSHQCHVSKARRFFNG